MGYRVEILRELEVRIILVRVVVHGIRHWTDIHVPLLALTSERIIIDVPLIHD